MVQSERQGDLGGWVSLATIEGIEGHVFPELTFLRVSPGLS